MKQRALLSLIVLFIFNQDVLSQSSLNKLRNILLKSDSVILVAHNPPSLEPRDKMRPEDYRLIVNNGINFKNITKYKKLTRSEAAYLSHLVTRPFKDSIIEKGRCFIPRHTIFFIRRNKVSYIDLCFQCQEFESSKDVKIPEEDFDSSVWKQLEDFFIKKGFLLSDTALTKE